MNILKIAKSIGAEDQGAGLIGGAFIGAVRVDWLERFVAAIDAAKAQEPVCSVCCKYHDKENPVGYFLPPANELDSWEQVAACDNQDAVPLYAAPVRTKDLTDDELYKLYMAHGYITRYIDFARAVIAKFKRKNNAA